MSTTSIPTRTIRTTNLTSKSLTSNAAKTKTNKTAQRTNTLDAAFNNEQTTVKKTVRKTSIKTDTNSAKNVGSATPSNDQTVDRSIVVKSKKNSPKKTPRKTITIPDDVEWIDIESLSLMSKDEDDSLNDRFDNNDDVVENMEDIDIEGVDIEDVESVDKSEKKNVKKPANKKSQSIKTPEKVNIKKNFNKVTKQTNKAVSIETLNYRFFDDQNSNDEQNTDDDSDRKTKQAKKIAKVKKAPVQKKAATNVRTVMYLEDDEAKPVTAGGAIFYKKVNGKLMLLIIENRCKYEDIGGKIDPGDADVFHAVAREIQEETNEQIIAEDVIERLQKAPYIYVPRSKYVIYLIEASPEEKKLKKEDFGDEELHDGFPRTIGWISREELIKPATIQFKMNWRLKTKTLFNKLAEIEKTKKISKKLFSDDRSSN